MYYQTAFSVDEFSHRRARIFDAIGSGVAVIQGAPATGAFDLFRQTNEFFYLCGVEVPHAYLRLDGQSRRTTLYLPLRDPKHERSEGKQLHASDPESVIRITGIDEVKPLNALALDLTGATHLFTPQSPAEGRQACRDTLLHARHLCDADPWDMHPSAEQRFRQKLSQVSPQATIDDLSPILDQLRLIKSAAEIGVMRHAGVLTGKAIIDAMCLTRPGLVEFELAAIADYRFLQSGARGPGYRPIVASGKNIWNAHYYRNNCPLHEGDLVLMDYAPECDGYTSDIGRMWPVNKKYSTVQRELYGFVVEYHKVLLNTIRPHVFTSDLAREAAEAIRPLWNVWRWSKDAYREAAKKMIDSEVAFTHPVGMAVHDVGQYRSKPLQPGLVFALDPQLWVPDEELYVRVEDTVVITDSGVESLTKDAPLDLDDVESLLQ